MKSSSWQSSAICSLLLGVATVWVWARHGVDLFLPSLFIVSVVIDLYMKNNQDRRITNLQKVANDAVTGRLFARVTDVGLADETGILCRNFNQLLDKLEESSRNRFDERIQSDERISILQKTASDAAAGRLSARIIDVGTDDDTGILCRNINKLLEKLDTSSAHSPDARIMNLQKTVGEVAAGKLTGRITNIGLKDEIGILCWNINNMLDQIETSFREQETVFKMASQHKFFRNAQPTGLHGAYAKSLDATNRSLDIIENNKKAEEENRRVHRLAQEEIADLIAYAADGDFEKRLKTQDKEGFFLDLANNLNRLMGTIQDGLESVASVLKAISEGDLTKKIEQDFHGLFGSIKEDTNSTVDKLKDIVGQIKSSSEAVETAAREIAMGNQDLAERTSQQAGNLEQTSRSMEELSSTVKQNSENADKAKKLTGSANEVVNKGWEMVKNIADTMDDIQASSRKIGDIIGFIDSIAFQTNILALNAAVEAARAGEHGRGFAVVAAEVRNLAQRSANAAKEIKALIEESVGKVEKGADLVQQAGSNMEVVVNSFQNIVGAITEISLATKEQNTGIESVARAITSIDEVTQQNAALVEEAAAAAESLEEQADILVQSVGTFRLSSKRGMNIEMRTRMGA